MRKLKKNDILLIILGVALVSSLTSNIILIVNFPQQSTSRDPLTLVVGIYRDPEILDIVDSSDRESDMILEQVVETLFIHDLSDLNLPRTSLLAESYWWKNSTSLQIKLREGILFHDGTLFNASVVKWNFDRLQYLLEYESPSNRKIWMLRDGMTPIINDTEVNGLYNISIKLNKPFGPFLNLLTNINAGMISPTTHGDDALRFIDLDTEMLIGTGPFIFDYYIEDNEIGFSRWNEYWREVAYFKNMRFKIFDDGDDAKVALFNGEIDYNIAYQGSDFQEYEANDDIILKRFTDDTDKPNLDYLYLSIDNEKVNRTWRKAISYAINHSYFFQPHKTEHLLRAKSPISPAFGSSYNETIEAKSYNLSTAREIVVSMGFGDIGWDDSQWINAAESGSPFLSLIYSYIYFLQSSSSANLGEKLTEWLKLIGVNVDIETLDPFVSPIFWPDFQLCLYWWVPDYLDPYNTLNALFNPSSFDNMGNVNDLTLNAMMELALNTTDEAMRNLLYKEIQGYIVDVAYFQIPIYHIKTDYVHSASLRGILYNVMEKFQAHQIWRI